MGYLREYQEWVERFDRERGWDLVPATATCTHLAEEVGEVARAVLRLSEYKRDEPASLDELKQELADAVTFLVKLAYSFGIDLEEALEQNRQKCEARYASVKAGRHEIERFLDRELTELSRFRRELDERRSDDARQ